MTNFTIPRQQADQHRWIRTRRLDQLVNPPEDEIVRIGEHTGSTRSSSARRSTKKSGRASRR